MTKTEQQAPTNGANQEKMFNFLADDLAKLEEAIEQNNKEEIERFFSYWNQHLKQLKAW